VIVSATSAVTAVTPASVTSASTVTAVTASAVASASASAVATTSASASASAVAHVSSVSSAVTIPRPRDQDPLLSSGPPSSWARFGYGASQGSLGSVAAHARAGGAIYTAGLPLLALPVCAASAESTMRACRRRRRGLPLRIVTSMPAATRRHRAGAAPGRSSREIAGDVCGPSWCVSGCL
jgi:hypothetical protein